MKVKIGNRIYDSEVEPIMILFDSDEERIKAGENLSNMQPKEDVRKYCYFPSDMDISKVIKFMQV